MSVYKTASKRHTRRVFVALGLAVFFAGCNSTPADRPADDRLPVFVGIPPLAYLVEQIGGEHVEVGVLVQPGQDPHTFEPTPQQVVALSMAEVFFKIDMPFEGVLLEKVQASNQGMRIVDTTKGIKKRKMDAPCCEQAGNHSDDREPQGGEPDPHVWLSPPLLKILAKNITAALCRADPPHAGDYRWNLVAFNKRLDSLHQRIRRKLAAYHGRSFYVFHPGFGYFADAYGLKQKAVEAGGRSPSPKELRALIAEARADRATTIFVQPQYDPQSAEVVAEAIGGKIVPIDGLGKYVLTDIEDIATKIAQAMKKSSKP